MLARLLATFVSLALLSIAAASQAAPVFPLQVGMWTEMDKHDNLNPQNHWVVRTYVLEEALLDGNNYFHIQELNYDPYGGETFSDFYLRSTDTAVYFYNGPGLGETKVFQLGPVGTKLTYQQEGGTVYKEIVAIENITIPYGGTQSAYKFQNYEVRTDQTTSPYWYEWVVPGLPGLAQEQDYYIQNPAAAPYFSVLARVGANPLFFPLKTGMRLTYDASDQPGHTWKMTVQVMEQVTLNDGLTYFHMRQKDYDPIAGDVNKEFYLRCTSSQVYVRKLDENPAHLEYQAAAPGTSWNYPQVVKGTPGTIYKQITGIQTANVLGRSFPAYVTNKSPDPSFPMNLLMSEFIVPGMGPVEMLDWWIADPNRAPLQFLLTGVSQGGAGPAVSLLLMD